MSAALYSYYGDDFTGSTDVLEAVALAGLRSVLFLGSPSEEHLRQFSDCQAFGIAGDGRSRSPEWMDEHLPEIFARLRSFGAPVMHYKTCSTFDSSPRFGSIGRALEIGRNTMQSAFVPILVAAPHLRRYVVFGNLFAAAGDQVYRIDRHPTMRQHPVTPMSEADLRRHLAQQTRLRLGLIDLVTLQSGAAEQQLALQLAMGEQALFFDGFADSDLQETGRLIWQYARCQPLFAVGSSGLTYSLVAAWKNDGTLQNRAIASPKPPATDRLLVMSGSCSPVTERQIKHALRNGYEGIAIDPTKFHMPGSVGPSATATGAAPSTNEAAAQEYVAKAITALRSNGKVVLYSSLGPLSPGIAARGDALGSQIGSMLRTIIGATGVKRVVLAGGDTSSHAVSRLGLYALTWSAATQPGAPLCRTHSDLRELDGLELVLKGGQVGTEDFFEQVRTSGHPA